MSMLNINKKNGKFKGGLLAILGVILGCSCSGAGSANGSSASNSPSSDETSASGASSSGTSQKASSDKQQATVHSQKRYDYGKSHFVKIYFHVPTAESADYEKYLIVDKIDIKTDKGSYTDTDEKQILLNKPGNTIVPLQFQLKDNAKQCKITSISIRVKDVMIKSGHGAYYRNKKVSPSNTVVFDLDIPSKYGSPSTILVELPSDSVKDTEEATILSKEKVPTWVGISSGLYLVDLSSLNLGGISRPKIDNKEVKYYFYNESICGVCTSLEKGSKVSLYVLGLPYLGEVTDENTVRVYHNDAQVKNANEFFTINLNTLNLASDANLHKKLFSLSSNKYGQQFSGWGYIPGKGLYMMRISKEKRLFYAAHKIFGSSTGKTRSDSSDDSTDFLYGVEPDDVNFDE